MEPLCRIPLLTSHSALRLVILESFPVQVQVIARGNLPDPCTEVSEVLQEREGNTFFITGVEPGPHYLFVVAENTVGGHINFKTGKTYSLTQGVTMGVWSARTTGFYPLTQEEAAAAMTRCEYQEYDPSLGGEDMDPQQYEQAVRDYEIEVKENPEGFRELLEYKGY